MTTLTDTEVKALESLPASAFIGLHRDLLRKTIASMKANGGLKIVSAPKRDAEKPKEGP